MDEIYGSGVFGASVNAKVATVLGSIPASSEIGESEGAADEAVLNNVHNKEKSKRSPCKKAILFGLADTFCMDVLNGRKQREVVYLG